MIALADCNSFYASCEKVFRPDLTHKPVVVLSNNDGCIIARSHEAKKLGVKMGEPYFKRKEWFVAQGITAFSANFTLYGTISSRIMKIFQHFSPQATVPTVEIYSIDEAFLNLEGIENPLQHCQQLKSTIEQWTGIPISIGIAPTKTLAKLANHLAKKHQTGTHTLIGTTADNSTLENIAVQEIWGIGEKKRQLLESFHIFTALDFKNAPSRWVQQKLSITGLRTHQELHGFPCIPIEEQPQDKQNICTSRSFGTHLTQLTHLEEALCEFVSIASEKLRKQSSNASYITVFIHTDPFLYNEKQYHQSIHYQLPEPTNSTLLLCHYAKKMLHKIFQLGYKYKKAGIILNDITPQTGTQLSWDNQEKRQKHNSISAVMDKINDKYGKQILKVATAGTERPHKMRQQNLSPHYLTNWEDLPLIKV
jgi:DNA polymerase V